MEHCFLFLGDSQSLPNLEEADSDIFSNQDLFGAEQRQYGQRS
jgi:hypothetical protein